jgi:hypothetical protein
METSIQVDSEKSITLNEDQYAVYLSHLEKLKTLSDEQRAELSGAFEEIKEIYPSICLGAVSDQTQDRGDRRAEFKVKIDRLELALEKIDKYLPEECIPIHRFTEGMYIREIHVPAGAIFTSMTHKTQHPFVISKGMCDICNEVGDVTRYSAPHTGITEPGTRRVFLVHSDLVLTTFHATDIKDPDEWISKNTECENKAIPRSIWKCLTSKGS